jgi:DNA (cytosine-5)-methyltransferase 1
LKNADRNSDVKVLDLFSGAGGSSLGARLAGARVVGAVDLWKLAAEVYKSNFPAARHYSAPCESLSPDELLGELGGIDLILASPECTNHTCARGSAARDEKSRETAFQVIRFAEVLNPRWIVVENVVHMKKWHRYKEWIDNLKRLGYNVSQQVLNAADFGVPQSRRRLFVLCDKEMSPPEIRPPKRKHIPIEKVISCNGTYDFSKLRTKTRAKDTLARARRAIRSVGKESPFLIVYYGTDGGGGWQKVTRPLRTITTLDRFAFVRPSPQGHEMRMLQVPELKKAMGFPAYFKFEEGTRRDRIKLLGNAVCPPVMRAIIRKLVSQPSLS